MRRRNFGWVGLVLALAFGLFFGRASATGSSNGKAAAATAGAGENGGATGSHTAGSARSVGGGDSVLMHHKSLSRAGLYVQPVLTKAAVMASFNKDPHFNAVLGPREAVYAQPLFVDGGGRRRDLLIVATEANDVFGLDGASGARIWKTNLGMPVPLAMMPCGNINPYGVTGTPVIDLASRTLFVDGMTTPNGGVTKRHLIFALSIDDGSIKKGWPVDVGARVTSGGTAFRNAPQSQRGALAVVDGTLYVPYGGLYGDCDDYHGWLVAVSISDPKKVQAWATAASAGGAWAPGGVASDGTNLYLTTGNTRTSGTWGGGEGLLRFTPGASFATPAYWAPRNWMALDNGDLDIGGSGAVLFDLSGATPSQLAIALGKDGYAYLLDRNRLGGVSDPVAVAHVASDSIINAAAVYTTASATYVAFRGRGIMCTAGTSGDLTTIKILPGSPPTIAGSWCAAGGGGSPMVTTSDGHADAIVWTLGAGDNNALNAFDGDTGAPIAYPGKAVSIPGMRPLNTPIAARGRIYVPADGAIVAFKSP